MSALRFSAPGQPTRIIDQGPSTPSSSVMGYVIRSANTVGSMQPILKGHVNFAESKSTAEKRRERNRIANEAWRAKRKAPVPRPTVYATEEERIEAKRATWRKSKARMRASKA